VKKENSCTANDFARCGAEAKKFFNLA